MNEIIVKEIQVKDLLTKSNLPDSDYVINPYTGCAHGCRYCYASFMKRFSGHKEPWGSFVDVKHCDKLMNTKKLIGKTVFLSSVTDCYQPIEEQYEKTRSILKQLRDVDCTLNISTKSKLILRDIDLLTKCKHCTVSMSINTLDEDFRRKMDHASTIEDRFSTLKQLHEHGIYTILFMSPIFPMLTDWKGIIEKSRDFVDCFWFENLNLRGTYKKEILDIIKIDYPQYMDLYDQIYHKKDKSYWQSLAKDIHDYCMEHKIPHINYFYHEELVEEKKQKNAS